MNAVPGHLATALRRELDEGEEILWSAQPASDLIRDEARPLAIAALIGVSFFGVLITPLSIIEFFENRAVALEHDGGPWLFVVPLLFSVFGLVIIAAGVWVYFATIKHAITEASETVYAVTPNRAIVLRVKQDGTSIERDYRADELIHLARREHADGRGTLTFESARGSARTNETASAHKFRAIDDVIEVERMLRNQFGDT